MSTTASGKAVDRAMSYNHSSQETDGYLAVLAPLTKGGGSTTFHQNRLQAVDMGG